MVVTVRYDDTGDTETFLLGVRGAEYVDMDVYSVQRRRTGDPRGGLRAAPEFQLARGQRRHRHRA